MTDTEDQTLRFVDLHAQRRRIGSQLLTAIERVLEHGSFIMGPEVTELELALSSRTRAAHTVTCSSGTEALVMVLLCWDVGPGDVVFLPSFTFAATAEAACLHRATPFFVDVDGDTFTMDPNSLKRSIQEAKKSGMRPRTVIPVDLFGHPAGYEEINAIAAEEGMKVLADAAQSLGGSIGVDPVGTHADATTTSFFPAKPLGCYGDGGAIFTDSADDAATLRSIRVHGKGATKYDNVRVGLNGRLDTIQAAVLLQKLEIFDQELLARQQIADRYSEELQATVRVPSVRQGARSAWAQYTVLTERRNHLKQALDADAVPTAIYYPAPLHELTAYVDFPRDPKGMSVSEELARAVLSLPIHPYLTDSQQEKVVSRVRLALS